MAQEQWSPTQAESGIKEGFKTQLLEPIGEAMRPWSLLPALEKRGRQ